MQQLLDLLGKMNAKHGRTVTLQVVKSDVLNAWTLGQAITITTRLLSELSKAEVDAVMLHEFGHAFHGHTCQRCVLLGAGIVAQSGVTKMAHKSGSRRWLLAGLGLMAGRAASFPVLARHQEYQADGFALQEGYGPALSSALRKITAGREDVASLSHPSTNDRVAQLEPVNLFAAARKAVGHLAGALTEVVHL